MDYSNQQEFHLQHQQQQEAQAQVPPQKKRRNQPGTPNPDAEVIALSPNSLMATNRFLCEVCNKGFQREQNLQLHRRGHNLPWKLKQKNNTNNKEVRRKVYLCPEPTCVHHDPSRALGDLTGVKKHYFRKHGEKKFKCEKCSKKYAVQSDWKAHSKTCGTRDYKCDCGTVFSRRDSFITHRAFCDALAQETARNPLPTLTTNNIGSNLFGSNNNVNLLSTSKLGHPSSTNKTNDQFDDHNFNNIIGTSNNMPSTFFLQESNQDYAPNKPIPAGLMHLPNIQHNNMFNLNFFQNNDNNNVGLDNDGANSNLTCGILGDDHNNTIISTCSIPSLYGSQFESTTTCSNNVPMSATALLQKAAQMGSTTSSNNNTASLLKAAFGACESSFSSGTTNSGHQLVNFDVLPGVMNAYGGEISRGYNTTTTTELNYEQQQRHQSSQKKQLTRDFLGVGEIVRSMSGGFSSSQTEQQQQYNKMMMSSLDSQRNQSQQSFGSPSSTFQ